MTPQIDKLPETPKCSNNGCSNPLDTTGTPKWCKRCRADYQKEHRALEMDRKERQGYIKGAKKMREILAAEFAKLGIGTFSGDEVAELIQRAPGPLIGMDDEG
jgi:hypothetical protein